MYSVNHTTHTLISHSEGYSNKVRTWFNGYVKSKTVFAVCVIKGNRTSFFETYEEAKAHQAMLSLHGGF